MFVSNGYSFKHGLTIHIFISLSSVSPDGLLRQSSTVADSVSFQFCDNVTESVPCSYIEFAERLLLPQYKDLPDDEVTTFFWTWKSFFALHKFEFWHTMRTDSGLRLMLLIATWNKSIQLIGYMMLIYLMIA